MRISQEPFSRFVGAVILAPVAGAILAFVAIFIIFSFAGGWSLSDIFGAAASVGLWTLIVCYIYVVVVGTSAYVYARVRRRVPALATALIVGIVTGVVPFVYASLGGEVTLESFALPAFAAACSVATAWTFWRLAFFVASDAPARRARARKPVLF